MSSWVEVCWPARAMVCRCWVEGGRQELAVAEGDLHPETCCPFAPLVAQAIFLACHPAEELLAVDLLDHRGRGAYLAAALDVRESSRVHEAWASWQVNQVFGGLC